MKKILIFWLLTTAAFAQTTISLPVLRGGDTTAFNRSAMTGDYTILDLGRGWGLYKSYSGSNPASDSVYIKSDNTKWKLRPILSPIAVSWGAITGKPTIYSSASALKTALETLTGSARLDTSAIKNLRGITSESDPNVGSHIKAITTTNVSNWSTAYGWGNHASAGYLTTFTESDPGVGSHIKAITTTNISDWTASYRTAAAVRNALATLSGTDRLSATYIKDLPSDVDISGKANLASPTFTGTPLVPTASAGTNTTQAASTAFVKTAVDTRVLIVSNVAALKATTGVSGQIAHTSGYRTPNDGGGNAYYWNASSTATKDSGFVFQVNGVSTGRWIAVNQTTVNLLQFGAKCDNSSDDTPYVANALSKQRHTVAPKAAYPYLVSDTLDVYANITCENGAVFKVANSYVGALFRIQNLKGLNIEGLYVDAQGTGIRTTGLLAEGLWNSFIKGYSFLANSADTSSIGIHMVSSKLGALSFGNYVNYIINPYIYRGKIGIKSSIQTADDVRVTQLNVAGGWISNHSYANIDLHGTYNFNIVNVAFDVIRTGTYGLRTDDCHQGAILVGEWNSGGGKIANISSNSNLIDVNTLLNVNLADVVDGDRYRGKSAGEIRLFPANDPDYQTTIRSNNSYGTPFEIIGHYGSSTEEQILKYSGVYGFIPKTISPNNSVGSGLIGTNANGGLVSLGSSLYSEGTAAPVSGTWSVGDYRKNTTPSAGGYMGWVCVTAGTPGTWKGYGAIQP